MANTQEHQKLPSDFQVGGCVTGWAYPLPFTSFLIF